MNSYETFQQERNYAEQELSELLLRMFDCIKKLSPKSILEMTDELEKLKINPEKREDMCTMATTIRKYHMQYDPVRVLYDGECIDVIFTNHCLSLEDALNLLGINPMEMDNGDFVWDYELFTMEW